MEAAWRDQRPFNDVEPEWRVVCESFALPLYSANENRLLLEALLKFVAAADEASIRCRRSDS
jgi:hypothetical protein